MKIIRLIVPLMIAISAHAEPQPPTFSITNPMVADVSNSTIEIRSDFNGTQLLVFGARNVPGDIVIAVRGPLTNAVLRRKERIAGMWMNVDQRKYFGLPIFYALASTRPINKLAPPKVLQALGLGERRVMATAASGAPEELFDASLGNVLIKKRWWQMPFSQVTYFGESLFKAKLDLPDTLPSGDYTVEISLFNRGKLIGIQTIPLKVFKTGLDARIAITAKENSLLYGLVAVLMALFGGWLGHRLFYRR